MNVEKYLNQTLCYWRKTGSNSGGPVYAPGPPLEIPCRWEDEAEEVISTSGRKITRNTHIMTAVDLIEGSWVFLGTIADWKLLPGYPKTPTTAQGGFELTKSLRTPNKQGEPLLFEFYL